MNNITNEKTFEVAIVEALIEKGGYSQGNRELMLKKVYSKLNEDIAKWENVPNTSGYQISSNINNWYRFSGLLLIFLFVNLLTIFAILFHFFKRKVLVKKILLVIFSVVFGICLFSHPHIFTIVNADFVFDDNGLKGIEFVWNLDDMSSSIVMEGYDLNYDDQISEKEAKLLLEENTALQENNYFFDMKLNDKTIIIEELQNFKVDYIDLYVSYSFFLPIKAVPKSVLEFEIYDKTYYSAFFLNENDITFTNDEDYIYTIELYQNKNKAYYQGMVIPKGMRLILKEKKWRKTSYLS